MRNFVYKGVEVRINAYEALVYWTYGGNMEEKQILAPEGHPLFPNEEDADDYMERIVKEWINKQLE
jgi:hypothetical protein